MLLHQAFTSLIEPPTQCNSAQLTTALAILPWSPYQCMRRPITVQHNNEMRAIVLLSPLHFTNPVPASLLTLSQTSTRQSSTTQARARLSKEWCLGEGDSSGEGFTRTSLTSPHVTQALSTTLSLSSPSCFVPWLGLEGASHSFCVSKLPVSSQINMNSLSWKASTRERTSVAMLLLSTTCTQPSWEQSTNTTFSRFSSLSSNSNPALRKLIRRPLVTTRRTSLSWQWMEIRIKSLAWTVKSSLNSQKRISQSSNFQPLLLRFFSPAMSQSAFVNSREWFVKWSILVWSENLLEPLSNTSVGHC